MIWVCGAGTPAPGWVPPLDPGVPVVATGGPYRGAAVVLASGVAVSQTLVSAPPGVPSSPQWVGPSSVGGGCAQANLAMLPRYVALSSTLPYPIPPYSTIPYIARMVG